MGVGLVGEGGELPSWALALTAEHMRQAGNWSVRARLLHLLSSVSGISGGGVTGACGRARENRGTLAYAGFQEMHCVLVG